MAKTGKALVLDQAALDALPAEVRDRLLEALGLKEKPTADDYTSVTDAVTIGLSPATPPAGKKVSG